MMNDMSNMPTGGMIRRTGRSTGSVRSNNTEFNEAKKVPPRTGNHEKTARPPRTTM